MKKPQKKPKHPKSLKPKKPAKKKTIREASESERTECYIDLKDEDVIITDPCYLADRQVWLDFCKTLELEGGKPSTRTLGGVKMAVADTIWGDWLCDLFELKDGKKTENSIGTFTADSGTVCAAVMKADYVPRELPKLCYSVLHGFTGRIIIIHDSGVCRIEGIGETNGKHIEFISQQR